jgi:hypothetical protein
MQAVTREHERAEFAGRRARIIEMYADGAITRDDYQRRLRDVVDAEGQLADQETAAAVVKVPTIDWTWPAERVNEVLRAIWSVVIMDETMQPVRAERILPPEYWA